MKSLRTITCFAGLFALLVSTALAAFPDNSDRNNSEGKLTGVGWVPSPTASFNVRTVQTNHRSLAVQISKRAQQGVVVQLQTLAGIDLMVIPVSKRQAEFGVQFNVSDLEDGEYRLVVSSKNEEVVKLINLKTPPVFEQPTRLATLKVVSSQ